MRPWGVCYARGAIVGGAWIVAVVVAVHAWACAFRSR